MPCCIVKGCKYSWRKKDPNISIHGFPKDLEIIKKWLIQTKQDFGDIDEFSRKILEGTKGAYRVCSRHFTADSYKTIGSMTVLKKGAIPTIFSDSPVKPICYKKAKGPAKRLKVESSFTNYGVPGVGCQPSATAWHPASIVALSPHGFMSPVASTAVYGQGLYMFTTGGHLGIPHDQSRSLCLEHGGAGGQNIKEEKDPIEIGSMTGLLPGQIHQSTNTDPYLGTSNKKVQANLRKPQNSVGIQCNMEELPAADRRKRYPFRISLGHFDVLIWVDPFRHKADVHPKALDLD